LPMVTRLVSIALYTNLSKYLFTYSFENYTGYVFISLTSMLTF
jgi:hypothetical protein